MPRDLAGQEQEYVANIVFLNAQRPSHVSRLQRPASGRNTFFASASTRQHALLQWTCMHELTGDSGPVQEILHGEARAHQNPDDQPVLAALAAYPDEPEAAPEATAERAPEPIAEPVSKWTLVDPDAEAEEDR